jgi:hypothetical protein
MCSFDMSFNCSAKDTNTIEWYYLTSKYIVFSYMNRCFYIHRISSRLMFTKMYVLCNEQWLVQIFSSIESNVFAICLIDRVVSQPLIMHSMTFENIDLFIRWELSNSTRNNMTVVISSHRFLVSSFALLLIDLAIIYRSLMTTIDNG